MMKVVATDPEQPAAAADHAGAAAAEAADQPGLPAALRQQQHEDGEELARGEAGRDDQLGLHQR